MIKTYSVTNYIDTQTPKPINIIHINIRSARKNLDEFLINLERTKKQNSRSSLELKHGSIGKKISMKFLVSTLFIRSNRKKGGLVSILIQWNITATIILHLTVVNEMCESLPVELVYNNDTFSIVGIYRSPSTSLEILKHFNMFMDNDRNKYMAIIGDFNTNTLAHLFSNQVNQFLDEIKSLHFFSPHQHSHAHHRDKCNLHRSCLYKSTLFNKYGPIKLKCIALKSYCCQWLNNTLRNSIKEKHRLHNLCQEIQEFVALYKQKCNLVSYKIKQAGMQNYNDKFNNNLHDAKSTWKFINNIL